MTRKITSATMEKQTTELTSTLLFTRSISVPVVRLTKLANRLQPGQSSSNGHPSESRFSDRGLDTVTHQVHGSNPTGMRFWKNVREVGTWGTHVDNTIFTKSIQ